MQQSLSSGTNYCMPTQKISPFLVTQNFITVFSRFRYWSLSQVIYSYCTHTHFPSNFCMRYFPVFFFRIFYGHLEVFISLRFPTINLQLFLFAVLLVAVSTKLLLPDFIFVLVERTSMNVPLTLFPLICPNILFVTQK